MSKLCPNYNGCRLVNTDVVEPDKDKKARYLVVYCEKDEEWKKCLRFVTRKSLWIAPDFLLPDSEMTEEEIIEKYENEKEEDKDKTQN
jgi:hypothetical protein